MKFLKKLFERKPKIVKVDIAKRFELLTRTGQGSMSKVWRARDHLSGRVVALKLLDIDKTKRFEARFKGMKIRKPSEGEIAVQLKHPHIVKTLEHGITTNDEQFLVMEFVEGVCLSYLVDVQNEQMQKNRLWYCIQLGEAIRYFHQQKWIHRDICPRNILVTEDDQIKLIDFGLVVPNTAPFQQPGNRTGTANYMAPELIKRQKTDQRLDIFSYAVTCYEMYTRRYPWDAGETLEMAVQHINSPPVKIDTLVPGIDSQVAEAIMKGLALDPRDRWQKIDDMIDQFREARARIEDKV
jgi:serine/threonine protein kinase